MRVGTGMRSQTNSSMRIWASRIGACEETKCLASRMPKASGDSMPCSLPKAYTVFLVVSVGRQLALSPVRWTSRNSPRSATETLRSRISCQEPSLPLRVTFTMRFSALPYWFCARTCLLMLSSFGYSGTRSPYFWIPYARRPAVSPLPAVRPRGGRPGTDVHPGP